MSDYNAKRILLVEDEESIREVVKLNLELEGYSVTIAKAGGEAVDKFRSAAFDLILLDVMLPEMDGFAVCRTIRLEDTKTPILFLTARNAGIDRVQGLKIGGDDYLSKPFNLEELLLRVKILINRSNKHAVVSTNTDEYEFSGNKINFLTFEITTYSGESKQLSKRELNLLKLLIERSGEVVSREEILETVWGYNIFPSTRTIDNYILAFRKMFEPNPKEPKHFFSVRGVGYKFVN
ncbi:MAG: response regulator transcription factor [Luteibaculaceae bacterium]